MYYANARTRTRFNEVKKLVARCVIRRHYQLKLTMRRNLLGLHLNDYNCRAAKSFPKAPGRSQLNGRWNTKETLKKEADGYLQRTQYVASW